MNALYDLVDPADCPSTIRERRNLLNNIIHTSTSILPKGRESKRLTAITGQRHRRSTEVVLAKILIVDDRATDREFLEVILDYAGHTVYSASDGEVALRVARAENPNLAIVDIVMPTMDGLEFVRRLRSVPKLASTRIIFYTAGYLGKEAMHLAEIGRVDKVLLKPAEPETILAAVDEALGTQSGHSSASLRSIEQTGKDGLLGMTLHRTQRELESLSQRFAMIVQFARDSTAVVNPRTLVDRLGSAARSIVGAKYAVMGLFNGDGQRFVHVSASGISAEKRLPFPFPDAKSGLYGELLAGGSPIRRRVPGMDPQEFGLPEDSDRISSVLAIPIAGQHHSVGVISLLNKIGAEEFSDEEATVAETMVAQVSVAYENARLIQETDQRLSHLNTLRAIDLAISASTDRGLTLSVILDHIVTHLRVSAAAILLVDRGTDELVTAAVRGLRSHGAARRRVKIGTNYAGVAAQERRSIVIKNTAALAPGEAAPPKFGDEQFQAYVVLPLVAKGRTLGVLEIFNRDPLERDEEWYDFLTALADQTAVALEDAELFGALKKEGSGLSFVVDSVIEGVVRALDVRNMQPDEETSRATNLTVELAKSAGCSAQELEHIRRGAMLHDIGTLGVPEAILTKPGPLNDVELAIVKRHPQLAYEWLKPIAFLRNALDIPYCHHEKWDGSGYPHGIKREAIPQAARLFAVVDVWDSLTSKRPYRAAWSVDRASAHVKSLSGSHLDPRAVELFFTLMTPERLRQMKCPQ